MIFLNGNADVVTRILEFVAETSEELNTCAMISRVVRGTIHFRKASLAKKKYQRSGSAGISMCSRETVYDSSSSSHNFSTEDF
jgi:hypothetical protein